MSTIPPPAPPTAAHPVTLDGRSLTPAGVAAVARGGRPVTLSRPARTRNRRARAAAARLVEAGAPVYGRTTGVGARKDTEVEGDGTAHAGRLLRSHAGGAGPLATAEAARALLVVRLNQIGAGGAGVGDRLVDAAEAALNAGLAPPVHDLGSVGTGDLTALAEAALCLRGERAWLGAGPVPAPAALEAGDALAWMSSAALSLGEAALASVDVTSLLAGSETVAALALLGVRGDHQSLDPRVQAARPHLGQVAAATHLRALVRGAERPPVRLQDSFAFRCLPQVHGAARDALASLEQVLGVELNASAENPLLWPGDPNGSIQDAALHNGNFLQVHLALAADQMRAALLQVGMSAVRQLAALLDPDQTGLSDFLAGPAAASSGLMVLEYTAQAALGELRADAFPVNLAGAHASRGVEDLASFADLAVRQLVRAVGHTATILGATLVAAHRAVHLQGGVPGRAPVAAAQAIADAHLSTDMHDRPLGDDVEAATRLITDGSLAAAPLP
jgi:histidine ammonia-lyase